MGYDEFFTDGDKPYAENLNDSLLLMDAFNVTVPCKLPTMFSNGEFSSTTNVKRKAGIAIVTLKSVASGVTVGTTSISGSGEVVFRIYPNFNSFYKWYSIVLEKTGSVNIAFKKTDGTSISASVGNDGVISEASALKELQEIDVVLTLSSATISSILVNFVNNQSSRVRTGALLEASQLVNVNGTVTSGGSEAVSGGTVYTALTAKEDLSNKVTTLDNSNSHYPSTSAVKAVTDTKENQSNKVTTLNSSDSNYPSCSAVKAVTDTKENQSNKVTTLDNSDTHYPSTSAINAILDKYAEIIGKGITDTLVKITISAESSGGINMFGASFVVNLSFTGLKFQCYVNSTEDTQFVNTNPPSNSFYAFLKPKLLEQSDIIRLKLSIPSLNNIIIFDKSYDYQGHEVTP